MRNSQFVFRKGLFMAEALEEKGQSGVMTRWTVEQGLYVLLLLAALFLRLFDLAGQPLSSLEASNAWAAWLVVNAITTPSPPTPTSPLLYTLHALLFSITGGGDGVARAISLLAGVGVVGLSWFLRPWLGRSAALLLALLFCIDPWLATFSRLADGASLSLFLGLLTWIGLLYWQELPTEAPGAQRWRVVTAVSAGLLLTSGPLAWSFLAVTLIFLFTSPVWPARLLIWRTTELHLALLPQGSNQARQRAGIGLLFGAALLLGATGWLTRLEGVGLVSHSLSLWATQLSRGETLYDWRWPFLRLVLDEPLALLFGVAGLALLWRPQAEGDGGQPGWLALHSPLHWRHFLTAWLVWGVLLWLAPGRNPFSLPMVGLPLLFVAALTAAHLLARLGGERFPVWESWLLVALLTVILVSVTFGAWALVAQPQLEMVILRTGLLFGVLAIMLVALFALWANWRTTLLLVGAYVGALLLLVTLSSHWELTQRHGLNEPAGFFAETTSSDVRRLTAHVQTISAQRTGDATQSPIQVQMAGRPDPVLGWYLRSMRNLHWVLAPDGQTAMETPKPLVVTLTSDTNDATLAGYMGSHYAIRSRWLPADLPVPGAVVNGTDWLGRLNEYWLGRAQPFLRWVLYRKVKETPPTDGVILWVAGER
jgi:hypothetical protein